MNIYSQISANKLRSYLIFFLFIFIVSGFFYIIGLYTGDGKGYFLIGLIFSLISTGISYFFSDKIILLTVQAHPAEKKEYFDFYTVTENLCISSGIPMPKLYVMHDESMNAFATGRSPNHAIVCATTGLLRNLERLELEGVIAHELSHIKNYDILLASVVSVLVGTIGLTADLIMRNMWWSGISQKDDEEKKSPFMFIFFILAIIVTPIVSTLIQLAISRKREFLADANGSLLTRYPEGLAKALEKISSQHQPLKYATTSTAHLFISNPLKNQKTKSWFFSLFSTHPPVTERIRILRSM